MGYVPDSDVALLPIWPLPKTGGLQLTRTIVTTTFVQPK